MCSLDWWSPQYAALAYKLWLPCAIMLTISLWQHWGGVVAGNETPLSCKWCNLLRHIGSGLHMQVVSLHGLVRDFICFPITCWPVWRWGNFHIGNICTVALNGVFPHVMLFIHSTSALLLPNHGPSKHSSDNYSPPRSPFNSLFFAHSTFTHQVIRPLLPACPRANRSSRHIYFTLPPISLRSRW